MTRESQWDRLLQFSRSEQLGAVLAQEEFSYTEQELTELIDRAYFRRRFATYGWAQRLSWVLYYGSMFATMFVMYHGLEYLFSEIEIEVWPIIIIGACVSYAVLWEIVSYKSYASVEKGRLFGKKINVVTRDAAIVLSSGALMDFDYLNSKVEQTKNCFVFSADEDKIVAIPKRISTAALWARAIESSDSGRAAEGF